MTPTCQWPVAQMSFSFLQNDKEVLKDQFEVGVLIDIIITIVVIINVVIKRIVSP